MVDYLQFGDTIRRETTHIPIHLFVISSTMFLF